MKWLSTNWARNNYGKGDFRSSWVIDEIKKPKVLNNLKKSSKIDKGTQQSNENLWNRLECLTIQ